MSAVQLSVFLGNEEGRLSEAAAVLAAAGINIRALTLADSEDFGVLRMIVDKPGEAAEALKNAGIAVKITEIIAVEVEDRPGGLSRVLETFRNEKINIEYMYAFVEKRGSNAVMVFRVENTADTIARLAKCGLKTLAAEDIYGI
ncbi:MAG TPA: ACT domain-containing protein [Candidatus Goldiibacteriota bacterium]|nr:ACT domain-containing protein [Candidatus Goldiibacteriota bacterium]